MLVQSISIQLVVVLGKQRLRALQNTYFHSVPIYRLQMCRSRFFSFSFTHSHYSSFFMCFGFAQCAHCSPESRAIPADMKREVPWEAQWRKNSDVPQTAAMSCSVQVRGGRGDEGRATGGSSKCYCKGDLQPPFFFVLVCCVGRRSQPLPNLCTC